jgi:hypothetical protein
MPVLIAAWAVAVVLAAGCLIWALLTPSGASNEAASNTAPTLAIKPTATKPAATAVTGPGLTVAGTQAPKAGTPSRQVSSPTVAPTPTTGKPAATAVGNAPTATKPPINETFGYGIQVNGFDDPDGSIAMTKQLGMTWIKQQVVWGSLEHEKGNMDWSGLDRIVRKANKADLKIMLSIVTAPTWSHPAIGADPKDDPNGIKAPPDDPNAYANLVAQVVQREKDLGYPVHAVEVWNEQNLSREWRTSPQKIDAARYIQMLTATYKKVKAIDPNIVVISGALSPTGVDNGVDAVDDFKYLQQMVNNGLVSNADCRPTCRTRMRPRIPKLPQPSSGARSTIRTTAGALTPHSRNMPESSAAKSRCASPSSAGPAPTASRRRFGRDSNSPAITRSKIRLTISSRRTS